MFWLVFDGCCLIDFDNAKIQLYFHFCKFLVPKQPHFKALFYTPFFTLTCERFFSHTCHEFFSFCLQLTVDSFFVSHMCMYSRNLLLYIIYILYIIVFNVVKYYFFSYKLPP